MRVLDASDAHGRFAVEVLAGLGAEVERAPLSDEALSRADVVVVGRAAREWLARGGEWPRLVWVAVTPFGLAGPRAEWAGDELIAQAAGGMVWPNGHPGAPPLRLPGDQATRGAGLHAALGALLGLLARRRDGRGRLVDVSLQESATAMLEHVAGEWFDHRDPAMRRGTLHWNGTFRVGRCRDGEVLLSHVGDWTALREWLIADGAAQDLADRRWDDVDERCRHAAHVFAVLDDWAARYAVDALVEQAQLRRLPFAPVWSFERFARELGEIPTAGIMRAEASTSNPIARSLQLGAPLRGIRVIDFTWVVAGPLATRVLADFGAEVIRVERPDARPPAGSSEANLQRGKRRLTLDLRSAPGLDELRALLRDADVVVDNFSRRVLPNLGFDDDALQALNPRLVIAHLTGFPAADARAEWAAFGPTMQAMAGLVDDMRPAGGPPAGPGFAYADTATAWAAAVAIVA
ncbi:MAG TPA: CoA transferase, partial [Candidatus Dormibacteraeota bacterium]|nr:CoA transferase [Candidatus Dormibacteraeota bacterium]